jgi:hypothetical protein
MPTAEYSSPSGETNKQDPRDSATRAILFQNISEPTEVATEDVDPEMRRSGRKPILNSLFTPLRVFAVWREEEFVSTSFRVSDLLYTKGHTLFHSLNCCFVKGANFGTGYFLSFTVTCCVGQ